MGKKIRDNPSATVVVLCGGVGMKAETFECACGHKLTGRKITLDSKDIFNRYNGTNAVVVVFVREVFKLFANFFKGHNASFHCFLPLKKYFSAFCRLGLDFSFLLWYNLHIRLAKGARQVVSPLCASRSG